MATASMMLQLDSISMISHDHLKPSLGRWCCLRACGRCSHLSCSVVAGTLVVVHMEPIVCRDAALWVLSSPAFCHESYVLEQWISMPLPGRQGLWLDTHHFGQLAGRLVDCPWPYS